VTAECPCGGNGWMWCPTCRRVDAGRFCTGIAKNCRNHRPVPTCPTCLPQPAPEQPVQLDLLGGA